jgi:hypothetical protein
MVRRSVRPRSPRYRVTLPVDYHALAQEGRVFRIGAGQTRDLSETGACLELPDRLSLGTALSLVLHMESDRLTVQATVVWVERTRLPAGGTLHGVIFSQITPEQRQGLQALLRRNRAVRSRAAVEPPVPIQTRALMPLRLLDLSLSGACIEHLARLWPGSSCVLDFPPPLGPLALTAQVVRSAVVGVEQGPRDARKLRFESGVAFLNVTPAQQAVLAHFLGRLASDEAGKAVVPAP